MIGYIYITTNKINNMRYIGKHHATVFEPEKYLGSNKHLLASIKKHGRSNFTCEMLQECFTEDELNTSEQYWINKYDAVNSPLFYNIAAGGEGGRVMLNRLWINNGIIEKRILKNEEIPDGFTLGGLKRNNGAKVSAAKKGKPSKSRGKSWFNNGIEQTMAYECPEGWVSGRLPHQRPGLESYNNGIEQKCFAPNEEIPRGWIKGKIPGTHNTPNKGKIVYNNGINHIYLAKDEIPPEGFVRGYTIERLASCATNTKPAKGKRWYNNGIEQRYFAENDIIPDGWVPGCCKIAKNKKHR